MATTTLNATFDGVTDVPRINGGVRTWDSGFMGYYSEYEGDPNNNLVANISLTGSNWTVTTMRFGGADNDNTTILQDLDGSTGRRIDMLSLGFNSDVDLISTGVRFITGWDGDLHDVTLGSGNVNSVLLYAAQNIITTGSGFVGSIETNGITTATIGTGGVGSINTGSFADTITVVAAAYAQSIITQGGNDTVTLNGGAALVSTGSGMDTVQSGDQRVFSVNTGSDDDTVTVGSGGADYILTSDGNDTVTTTSGYFDAIYTGAGADTVNIGIGGGELNTGGGDDVVTVADGGYVELINTRDGNDTINIGSGGAGLVRGGDGDDLIKVSETDPSYGLIVQGGFDSDTLSFANFTTTGVIFSLDLAGQFQNVLTGDISSTNSVGYFAEGSIENLIGSEFDDRLTGDQGDNVFQGLKGRDSIFGGSGADVIDGGKGKDRLYGGGGQDELLGGVGFDLLEGGKGDDTLDGGANNDVLRGAQGADIFVFGADAGTDKVKDFEDGTDLIRLVGHVGGFGSLTIGDQGGDLRVDHDGGVVLLQGLAGLTLTMNNFDFVA